VAFVGFGGGGGIGFGFGNVGWVPLAPYEVFHPWWGRGFYGANRFNRNINITNINISNTYRNARFNNAVSAVRVNDFQKGRFNNVARMNGNQIGQAGALQGHVPLAPGNASMRFSDRQASVIPRSTGHTQFFRQQQPTACSAARSPSQTTSAADSPLLVDRTMDGGGLDRLPTSPQVRRGISRGREISRV
jgi:hypothetical protein